MFECEGNASVKPQTNITHIQTLLENMNTSCMGFESYIYYIYIFAYVLYIVTDAPRLHHKNQFLMGFIREKP